MATRMDGNAGLRFLPKSVPYRATSRRSPHLSRSVLRRRRHLIAYRDVFGCAAVGTAVNITVADEIMAPIRRSSSVPRERKWRISGCHIFIVDVKADDRAGRRVNTTELHRRGDSAVSRGTRDADCGPVGPLTSRSPEKNY